MTKKIGLTRRLMIIFSIVFAGEIIFSLPFHVARFFRPTLLDVFGITNTQLGDIFGLYGIMAMLAYFPGGTIADRFNGRHLMSFSLFATAIGGLYFVQIPDPKGLMILFAYWGVTTIFLFWASMIKVTRQWGGEDTQGKAFGILDGGRGLVAAGFASIGVVILSLSLPANTEVMNLAQQTHALKMVITFYSAMTLFAAVLILFAIPKDDPKSVNIEQEEQQFKLIEGITTVIKQPKVWLQALIVLSAYCAYKSMDYFGIYSTTVLGFNDMDSARLVSTASYLRPVAAIVAGIVADRLQAGRVVSWGFILLTSCYLALAVGFSAATNSTTIIEINILLTFLLVFTIRAVYFALLEESKMAGQLTGTAVGVISVIGFTPDIFFAPVAGRLIDSSSGVGGFSLLFMLLTGISLFGFVAAYTLARRINKPLYIQTVPK